MTELNKEMYKKNLDYAHKWDAAIESRGDSPLSDARVFLALAIKLIEEKLVGGYAEDWTPITFREADDEEYEDYIERHDYIPREECKIYDCHMPDDGQEVLITTSLGCVCEDIFHADLDDFGFEDHYDPDEVIAWMPKPEPYKKEGEEK